MEVDARDKNQPPVLEDPTYPGRSGGYVARITGKLLKEAALGGYTQLLFPRQGQSTVISAGRDGHVSPLFVVPEEFYGAVWSRISAIFGESDAQAKVISYEAMKFTMLLYPSTDDGVLDLKIQRIEAKLS